MLVDTNRRDKVSSCETKAEAFVQYLPINGSRKDQVRELAGKAGKNGITRYEATKELASRSGGEFHQNCITRAFRELIDEGVLVKTDSRRVSGLGGTQEVLVLAGSKDSSLIRSKPKTTKPFAREDAWNATFMRLRIARRGIKGGPLEDSDLIDIESEAAKIVDAMEHAWKEDSSNATD